MIKQQKTLLDITIELGVQYKCKMILPNAKSQVYKEYTNGRVPGV